MEVISSSLVCPHCDAVFKLLETRIPYLLKCAHRICEACVNKFHDQHEIQCVQCHRKTSQIKGQRSFLWLCKDFYTIGLMLEGPKTETNSNSLEVSSVELETGCIECGIVVSSSCDVCRLIFCKQCFSQTHNKHHKAWSLHNFIESTANSELGQFSSIISEQLCALHYDCLIYCYSCNRIVCFRCDALSHENHETGSMHKENVTVRALLVEYKQLLLDNLEKSDRGILELTEFRQRCLTHERNTIEIINNVNTHLIGILQLITSEKTTELKTQTKEIIEKTNSVLNALQVDNTKLKSAINCITFLEEPRNAVNLRDFLNLLIHSFTDIAVGVEFTNPLYSNPFSYEFEVDMRKKLRKYAKLTVGASASDTSPKPVKIEIKPLKTDKSMIPRLPRPMRSPGCQAKNHSSELPATQLEQTATRYHEKKANAFSRTKSEGFLKPKENGDHWMSLPNWNAHQQSSNHPSPNESTKTSCVLSVFGGAAEQRNEFIKNNANHFQIGAVKKQNKLQRKIPKHEMVQYKYFTAEVLCINGIEDFYIRQNDKDIRECDNKLKNQMQEHYSVPINQKQAQILYNGFVGAAQVENEWYRAIITKKSLSHCEIFLLDEGRHHNVSIHLIKDLHCDFWNYKQAAIKCCLADVAPMQQYNYEYPEKVIKEFRKIAMQRKFKIKVMVTKAVNDENMPVPVGLYAFSGNGMRILFNSILVERLQAASSTGNESRKPIFFMDDDTRSLPNVSSPPSAAISQKSQLQRTLTNDATENRLEATVLNITNPGEFYVMIRRCEQELKKINIYIHSYCATQEAYKDALPDLPLTKKWIIGDNCLVSCFVRKSIKKSWNRGILSKVDIEMNKYTVFLRDKGFEVTAECSELIECPKECAQFADGAIKVHLADAVPTGGDKWTCSSIEKFQQTVERYKNVAITIVGQKNSQGSFPIHLWGVTYGTSPTGQQTRYHNLLEYLKLEGYVDTISKTKFEDQSFNFETPPSAERNIENISPEVSNYFKAGDLMVDINKKNISQWLPSLKNTALSFIGYPTYVDNNGIIYIQNEAQHIVAEEMINPISDLYENENSFDIMRRFKIGDAIIARYHADMKFYRGRIVSVEKHEKLFKVEFVDYGNVEVINCEQMFHCVVAHNVPLQVNKFRLAKVYPIDIDKGVWTQLKLDHIHSLVVDCKCKLKITSIDDDIQEAEIEIISPHSRVLRDLGEFLVNQKQARRRKSADKWPPMEQQPAKNKSITNEVNVFERGELERIRLDRMFREMDEQCNKLLKPFTVDLSAEETKDYMKKHNDKSNDAEQSFVSFKSNFSYFKPCQASTSYLSDEIMFATNADISRRRDHRGKRNKLTIEFFDLQTAEVSEFYCTFSGMVDCCKIYVMPFLDSLTRKIDKMNTMLAEIDEKSLIKFTNLKKTAESLCLVKKDSRWHRAKIIQCSDDLQFFDVVFMDSGRVIPEKVSVENVRKMMFKLRHIPRQTLFVTLFQTEINEDMKMNIETINNNMSRMLEGKRLKAVVQDYDEHDIPAVDLYDENDELAYQSLIDKNYIIRPGGKSSLSSDNSGDDS